jgi:hypothetical protein
MQHVFECGIKAFDEAIALGMRWGQEPGRGSQLFQAILSELATKVCTAVKDTDLIHASVCEQV